MRWNSFGSNDQKSVSCSRICFETPYIVYGHTLKATDLIWNPDISPIAGTTKCHHTCPQVNFLDWWVQPIPKRQTCPILYNSTPHLYNQCRYNVNYAFFSQAFIVKIFYDSSVCQAYLQLLSSLVVSSYRDMSYNLVLFLASLKLNKLSLQRSLSIRSFGLTVGSALCLGWETGGNWNCWLWSSQYPGMLSHW